MSVSNATENRQLGKTLSEVAAMALENYPRDVQEVLIAMRELILDVKAEDTDIGQLQEVLRWGELSFLTHQPDTGSMIRLATTRSGEPAMFFHCGTLLVETFRTQYSHVFDFEGNRALVVRMPVEETDSELRHCIKQALRYKLDRK